ncbi:MAG: CRTAC1 family protein [Verrucomicrobiae bacterium]|nr:CRTAC1 family protein [Verrucomicrobiae bacterium]
MKIGNAAILLTFFVGSATGAFSQERTPKSELTGFSSIFAEITSLESKSDPKCHATASRLEDFVYGTRLSDEARFLKNEMVTKLAARLVAGDGGASKELPLLSENADGSWLVTISNNNGTRELTISARDKRQYSSVAYSLRCILGAQQNAVLAGKAPNSTGVDEAQVEELKQTLDLYQLAVLQVADKKARERNELTVNGDVLREAWLEVGLPTADAPNAAEEQTSSKPTTTGDPFVVLKEIIEQKVTAYAAYNRISNQIFVRNLQVYFARRRWPADPAEGAKLKSYIAQSITNFAIELYTGADALARDRGDSLVRERDVSTQAQAFVAYRINEYEDAIFFPNLERSRQVTIESYDMDSFRDSGLHWRYLQFALEDPSFTAQLGADPFAAELLAENIAQFGVLMLRIAGEHAIADGRERLAAADIESGLRDIQDRITAHGKAVPSKVDEGGIISSNSTPPQSADEGGEALFSEVSAAMGIQFSHRSSDWLNRQLRSYLKTGRDTGTVTIPPAFGGSGIAAEDVNHDGRPDLLILSGLGNRLYLNEKGKQFIDVTEASGITWLRAADNRPGEPRQPIIADFDSDGHQDIFISYVNDNHRLYKGHGDGTFEDVTDQCGLGGTGLVGGPATALDFDNDGDLDLFIAYFGDYLNGVLPTLERRNRNGLPDKLFRNTGGMRFEEVKNAGVEDPGWGQAAGHTDFNGDGWQDIIVGNDFGVNGYYQNLKDGTFREVSALLGTDKPSYTMGIGIADLNRDQLPDIYISNIVTMNKDEKYVLPSRDTPQKFNPDKLANMRVVEANDLFLSSHKGDSGFAPTYERSTLIDRGYSSTGWSWDADFFDADNDGDEDLYVLNGMNEFNLYSSENPYYSDPLKNEKVEVEIANANAERNVFFSNEGGRLQDRSAPSGLDFLGNARSAAYLDFDGDGDLDIAVNSYHGPVRLFRNDSPVDVGAGWLKLRLIGDPSRGVPLDAVGAQVVVNGGTAIRGLWREVHSTIGYLSVHPKELHFGVGSEEELEIEIAWPDGTSQRFDHVRPNQTYTLKVGRAIEQVSI